MRGLLGEELNELGGESMTNRKGLAWGARRKTAHSVMPACGARTLRIAAAVATVLLVGTGLAFSKNPAPCISTPSLDATIFIKGVTCTVRNVGITPHTVTITITDNNNNALQTVSPTIQPGQSSGTGMGPSNPQLACVVTSAEGTLAALRDLAVVEQIILTANSDNGSPTSETEATGTIFNSCAPPKTSP